MFSRALYKKLFPMNCKKFFLYINHKASYQLLFKQVLDKTISIV